LVTIQVTYNSTGATAGPCTFTGKLASGSTLGFAIFSATVTILPVAGHIYWANDTTNAIGRANLDGSSPNQSFITGASTPFGVAVGP
jgi:hypothetical protein